MEAGEWARRLWALYCWCSELYKDPKIKGSQTYYINEQKLASGMRIYNRDERFGTEEEAVELLGRINALMNDSEHPDPIFDCEVDEIWRSD